MRYGHNSNFQLTIFAIVLSELKKNLDSGVVLGGQKNRGLAKGKGGDPLPAKKWSDLVRFISRDVRGFATRNFSEIWGLVSEGDGLGGTYYLLGTVNM